MSQATRQKVLVGLLGIVVLAAGARLLPSLLAGDGGGAAGPQRGARGAGGELDEPVARLEEEKLAAAPRDYSPGRDPFHYGQPPPPPGPTPEEIAAREAAEAQRRAAVEAERHAEEQAIADAPPPEPARPQPPRFDLAYLGSFGPASRRIAVFTDGEQIYNALVGDVIDDKFVVADIGYESVAIKYVDFPDEPATRVAIGS